MGYPFGVAEIMVIDQDHVNHLLPTPRWFKWKEVTTAGIVETEDSLLAETISEYIAWEIEGGGLPLEVYAAMTGRSVIVSGSTPNEQTKLTGRSGEIFPLFGLQVRAVDDQGGDMLLFLALDQCRLTEGLRGDFQSGQFITPGVKGVTFSPEETVDLFSLTARSGYFAHPLGVYVVGVSQLGGPDVIA